MRVLVNGRSVSLDASRPLVTLGRASTADIAIVGETVAHTHATLTWDGASWTLLDGVDTKGLFVDGRRISRLRIDIPVEVHFGDPATGPLVGFDPAPPATGRPRIITAARTPAPTAAPAPEPAPTPKPVPLPDPTPVGIPSIAAAAAPTIAPTAPPAKVIAAPPIPPPPVTVLSPTTPPPPPPPRGVTTSPPVFAAHDLVVETAGTRRLDQVTFSLARGEMLGILGGSGAGKSTLVKSITGTEAVTSGVVEFQNQNLYEHFEELRTDIGYVPQDDVLHSTLTVGEILRFGAMLRMPDSSVAEREERAKEVLDELGIAHRVDARVTELSGGQRKRLNVALELLSRPTLLILDEPTSGLDPANERSLMQLLRDLADGGRTIMVVTHSTESLHLCDRVLFLARGGITSYLGPVSAMPNHFGQANLIDAFAFVDNHPNPSSLRMAHPVLHRPPVATSTPNIPVPQIPRTRRWAAESDKIGHDFWVLLRRSIAVLRGDRRSAIFLLAQGPVIAALIFAAFGSDKLNPNGNGKQGAPSVLMSLVLAVIFIGAAGAVREIVKERAIRLREQAIGVSTIAYLASKVVLLGAIVTVQSVLITFFALVRHGGTDDGFLPFGAAAEATLAVALAGVGAVALGLLISAAVTSTEKAMSLLPVVLFAQLLLAGAIVSVDTVGIQQLSWFVGAQWGLDGVGSVNDLWNLRGCGFASPDGGTKACTGMWHQDASNYAISVIMLVVLMGAALHLTLRSLRKSDPVEVLKKAATR